MTDIYLGEYGKRVLIDLQYNVSSASNIRILFSSSAGTYSATCSILGANTTVSACDSVFSANKAVEWVIDSSAFSATGAENYVAWVQATFGSTAKLISSTFTFEVTNPGG